MSDGKDKQYTNIRLAGGESSPVNTPYNGSNLGLNYIPGTPGDPSGVEAYLNENQGLAHTFTNWAAQSLSGAVLGTIESASYLADLEQLKDKIQGSEQEYDNWLAKAMREAKENVKEAAPIYRSKEGQETFSPGSRSFWTSNSPDVISSVLSLLIPGAVAGKAGKMAAAGFKFGEAAQAGSELVAATLTSRYAESTMEANQVFQDGYKQYLQQRMPDEQARELAGQAASRTFNTNWILAIQDLYQYNSILKGFGKAAKAKSLLGIAGETAGQMISEGAEEGLQYVFSEEAKKAGANKGHGYFGDEFWNQRLSDYITSDEFKTNVALGAVGGGVFGGVGPAVQKGADMLRKQKSDIIDSLAKERANLMNDFGTSKKIDSDRLANNALQHLANGKLDKWIDTVEELKKVPDLEPDTRRDLDQHKDELTELVNINSQIKDSKIPKDLQSTAVADHYDVMRSTRLGKELEGKLNEQYNTLPKLGLPENLLTLKKEKINLEAIKELATKEPAYAPLAQMLANKFQDNLTALEPNKDLRRDLETQLITPKDKELVLLNKQIALNNSHVRQLKNKIAKYSTPEGVAQLSAEKAQKTANEVAKAAINKPNVTATEIKQAQSTVTDPQVQQQLGEKLNQIVEEQKDNNKATVDSELSKLEELPQEVLPTPENFSPEMMEQSPEDITPDMLEPNPEASLEPSEVQKTAASFGIGNEILSQLEVEKPTPKQKAVTSKAKTKERVRNTQLEESTAKSWLKEYQSHKDKDGNWVEDRDPLGFPIEQQYFAADGSLVPAHKIFATDENGVLLINTPQIKVGDKVLLVREDSFPYTITKGFKPTSDLNSVINVYQVDKNGHKIGDKPLFQLDSADSPNLSPAQQASNLRLRQQITVWGPNELVTTIQAKNIGTVKRGTNLQSISVLEHDYMGDNYVKLPHGAILGIVDHQGHFTFKGDNIVSLPKQTQDKLDELMLNYAKDAENLIGSTIVARTAPDGSYRMETLTYRQMTPEETKYVKDNLASSFKSNDFTNLKKVMYFPELSTGYFIAKDKKGAAKTPDLFTLPKATKNNRITLFKSGTGKYTLGIPLKSSQTGNRVWTTLEGNDIQNFLSNKPASITFHAIVEGKYAKRKEVRTPEQYASILSTMNSLIDSQSRQVDFDQVNKEALYTDPVTNQEYTNYYDFLKATNTVQTYLRGSNTIGFGQDNSFSYGSTTVYLDSSPKDIKTDIDPQTEELEKVEQTPPPSAPIELGPTTPISPEEIEEEFGPKYKHFSFENTTFNVIGEKELQWFKNNYGEEFLDIAIGVDKFIGANGVEAFGSYYNALVTLAQYAPEGTTYHEAGHFVFDPKNKLITKLEREKILKEAKKIYGELKDNYLEEKIMEDFERYKLSDGKYLPEVSRTKSFFSRILQFIKKLLGYKTEIQKLFEKIDTPNLSIEDRKTLYENRSKLVDPDQILNKRLPGFISSRYEQEALISARSKAIAIASEGLKQVSDVTKFLSNSINLTKILDQVKDYYARLAQNLEAVGDKRNKEQTLQLMTLNAMGVTKTPGYEKYQGSWDDITYGPIKEDGFKSKLLQVFSDLGFVVKYDLDKVEAQEQDEAERIYDVDSSLINPSSSISNRVRLLLHSIPSPVVDSKGQVIDSQKTLFGDIKPLDFRSADAMLALKLSDAIDPYERLQSLAKLNPIARVILNKLDEVKSSGDNQTFTEVMVKYRRDSNDKKTILLQEKEVFVPVAERGPDGQETTRVYTSRFIDANRNSVFRTILNNWRSEAERVNLITPTGELTTKAKKIATDFASLKAKQNTIAFEPLLSQFQTILKELGVTLPDGLIAELQSLDTQYVKAVQQAKARELKLKSLVFGENSASLEALINTFNSDIQVSSPFDGKTNVLEKLAKASAIYYDSVKTGAYLNENGDLEYPINLPSYLSEFASLLNSPDKLNEWVNTLEQDEFYKDNQFIATLKQAIRGKQLSKIRFSLLSAIRDKDSDAKMFGDRSEIDSLVSRLVSYFNNETHNDKSEYASIFIGTPANKAKDPMMNLPKKRGDEAYAFLKKVLANTVLNEISRIQNIKDSLGKPRVGNNPLPQEINNLKNATKFIYLPELNEIEGLADSLSNGEISADNYKTAKAKQEQVINNWIDQKYDSFLNLLESNDIIRVNRKSGRVVNISNTRIPKDIINLYGTPAKFLKEFFYNDTAYRLEMSKVFMGDLAFYKPGVDDYFKRMYQLVTPGYKAYTDKETSIVRGIYPAQKKIELPEINSLKELGLSDSVANNYKRGVNKTDAQSLSTIHGYRTLAKALGLWNDFTHEKIYQVAWKYNEPARQQIKKLTLLGEITEQEAKDLNGILFNLDLQPLKPFQYNDRFIDLPNGKRMLLKEQFKDSITPILPELANTHQGYKELHDYMLGNGFDVLSAEDAVKVGSYGVLDMTQPAEAWQKRRVSLDDIRFPQFMPSKKKEETSGTQLHKLIMGDVQDKTDYSLNDTKISGVDLKADYNKLWVEKLENGVTKLKDLLGMGDDFKFSNNPNKKIEQLQKLQLVLKQELNQRDLNDNYKDAINLTLSQLKGIEFNMPLSFPQITKPFEGIIVKLFDKYVTSQKSTGYTAVNLADFGVQKSDELRYVRNENGQLVEAEIGIAINPSEFGLRYGEHISPTGRVIWDKLNNNQQEALQYIAYRIPTSNKSSMLPVRVAMILPKTMNNIVMIPGETTLQMGLDFDVDKTQLLRRVTKDGKIDKAHVDTKLFNIYWSVLTNKEHLNAMLTPLSTARLEAIKDNYTKRGILTSETNQSPFTLEADIKAQTKNREEKVKVGGASRAATAHSVIQMLGEEAIQINPLFDIKIARKGPLRFGHMTSQDGSLISENLGEIQQAALDAAKTPLLAIFNITKKLLSPAETLVMLGYDLRTVTDFFMQPVVREWSSNYIKENEDDLAATESFLEAHPEVGSVINNLRKQGSRPTLSLDALSQALTSKVGENPIHDAAVLLELGNLLQAGKLLSNFTNVLSLDTFGDTSSIESLQVMAQQVMESTNTDNNFYIDPRVFSMEKAPTNAKRIAAFHEYSLEKPLVLANEIFPSTNIHYQAARDYILEALTLRKTNKDLLTKINKFIHFYKLQHDSALSLALGKVSPTKEPYTSRWRFTEPGNTIVEYFSKFMKNAKKNHPGLFNEQGMIQNKLLASIQIQTFSNNDKLAMLTVNNVTDDNNSDLVLAWNDLLNAKSEEVRTLAHDLIRYAIYTSAFNYSPTSFADLIPTDIWKTTGLANYWEDNRNSSIDNEGLLLNFVRHNYKKIKFFPQFFITSNGRSQSIIKSSRVMDDKGILQAFQISKEYKQAEVLPRFAIVKGRLYEQSPANPYSYKQLQSAGGDNFYEVSTDGRNLSRNPVNKDDGSPNPWKNAIVRKDEELKTTDPRLQVENRLRTFELGTLEGKPQTDQENDNLHNNMINFPEKGMVNGGETFEEASDRVISLMKDLTKNAANNSVIVTHNAVFGIIKVWDQEGRPDSLNKEQRIKYTKQDNTVATGSHFTIKTSKGKLFVVRHGETTDNVAKVFRTPSAQLTQKGIKQAETAAKALAIFQIPMIITSPMERAVETSRIILKAQGEVQKFNQPALSDSDIIATNPFIEYYLPNQSNDPKTVLEHLIKDETNPENRQALQHLLDNVSKIDAKIDVTADDMLGFMGRYEVITNNGNLVSSVVKINPNTNSIDSQASARAVIHHELEHAFTVGVLKNPQTELEKNFNTNLSRVLEEARQKLGIVYYTENKFEFIAELASNEAFRQKLRGADLWSRIIRSIRKVLGMKDSYDKLIEQRYEVISQGEKLERSSGVLGKPENKKPGKKQLTIFESMLSSLDSRVRELKRRRGKESAIETEAELKVLKELAKKNESAMAVRYLVYVNKEIAKLKSIYDLMDKTPEKLNAKLIAPMYDQLLSYNLLDELLKDAKTNPDAYVGKTGDIKQFITEVNNLRGEVSDLRLKLEHLIPYRVASFIKDNIRQGQSFEEVVDSLKVANGDVSYIARWLTPFIEVNDDTVKAFAQRYAEIDMEAYRKTQEELYKFDKVQQKTTVNLGSNRRVTIEYTSTGVNKALDDYDKWLKKKGKNPGSIRDKFDPILDKASFNKDTSEGISFIAPWTKEGKAILSIKEGSEDYPLKQLYETIVLNYLKSQEEIKLPSQRPGLRIPTIGRDVMEGFLKEKGIKETAGMMKEQFLNNFIERFDDNEYQQVDQHGNVIKAIPLRYTSKQDGKDGRLNLNEVSLDVASTTMLFRHEMIKRPMLLAIQDDVELAKTQLAQREVMQTKRIEASGLTPFLSSEREGVVLENGKYQTIKGLESKAYNAFQDLIDRKQYGIVKKREGDIKIGEKKVSASKALDAFLRFSGFRIMFGKIAIPLANWSVGELTMIKEMIGGNIIDYKDYLYGQKKYNQVALSSLSDLGRRAKQTEWGKLFTYFNPMDNLRPVNTLGIDTTWMRTVWHKIISTGGHTVEYKLAVNALGAVMNRFKVVNPEGKLVPMDQGIHISDAGKLTLKSGYKYAGKQGKQYEKPKTEISDKDINEVIQYTLRTYQLMNGVYNQSDKSAAQAYTVGRLVTFMRNWLVPGLQARWNTKHSDQRLGMENEGYYISSLIAFNNIYGKNGFLKGTLDSLKMLFWLGASDPTTLLLPNELALSPEEQDDLINMRKANIRKTLFELYMIAGLGLLIFAGYDDDDDSYMKYMAARIKRELTTYYDPTTAWDVLRSPTVALSTIEATSKLLGTMTDGGWNYLTGNEQEMIKSGAYKGYGKAEAAFWRASGLDFMKQFEDIDRKTDFVLKGAYR